MPPHGKYDTVCLYIAPRSFKADCDPGVLANATDLAFLDDIHPEGRRSACIPPGHRVMPDGTATAM